MGKNAKRRRDRKAAEEKYGTKILRRYSDGSRTIQLDAETMQQIQEQLVRFEEKFGRPPGPDDPIFFDPDRDIPVPISELKVEENMVQAMEESGMDRAFVYAYQQTGRLVTEANMHLLTDEDIQEWEDAVERYRSLHARPPNGDVTGGD